MKRPWNNYSRPSSLEPSLTENQAVTASTGAGKSSIMFSWGQAQTKGYHEKAMMMDCQGEPPLPLRQPLRISRSHGDGVACCLLRVTNDKTMTKSTILLLPLQTKTTAVHISARLRTGSDTVTVCTKECVGSQLARHGAHLVPNLHMAQLDHRGSVGRPRTLTRRGMP